MSIIRCKDDCKYQDLGYCQLDREAQISDERLNNGCLYFTPKKRNVNENFSKK